MTTWKVELTFSEGNSNKFWRARVDGTTLYVNYGRIGSDGQTQVKALGSADAAQKELEKLEREKRKKGYEDASGDPSAAADEDEDEDEDERPAPKKSAAKVAEAKPAEAKAAPPSATSAASAAGPSPATSAVSTGPATADLTLTVDGRAVELRLALDGAIVRTTVVERYASPADAARAFERLQAQMREDGYAPASTVT